MSDPGRPILVRQSAALRKHALEVGTSLLIDGEELKKADGASLAPAGVKWVPQPVSFAKLKSYRNPYHSRCVRIKARMSVGMGILGEPQSLPMSAAGDPFEAQIVTAAMDLEHTGNGYLEVITALGGQIAAVTWMPAETIEPGYIDGSPGVLWYRHTAIDPGSSRRRVVYYPAWPQDGKAEANMRYIMQVAQDGTWSTWYGEPDWLGALHDLMLSDSAMIYNRANFDNGCVPSWLIFLLGVKLDDEHPLDDNGNKLPSQRETVQSFFESQFGGAQNAGKALLLDAAAFGSDTFTEKANVVFQKLQDGPKDGDFQGLLDGCRDRIVAAHGVPPRLAGIVASGSLGGSGELVGQLMLFREDLTPKRRLWERACDMMRPRLAGSPEIRFAELDLDAFRDQAPAWSGQLPPNPTDADVTRAAKAMLLEARR
jgi:hypothetical protein